MPSSKPTGFDVARLAGVTQPTVSRALRNLPGVAPATRERVVVAARELAYIPSDRGRALATRQTRRVAVISEELTNPFYPELVEPLRLELAEQGYLVVLVSAPPDQGDGTVEAAAESLADGSYDGAILTTTRRRSRLPRDLTELGLPHVLVNRVLDVPESPSCGIDNRLGGRLVGQLLLDLGHRGIGAINGPVDTSTGRERAHGLRAVLRQRGVALPRRLTRTADYSHDAGAAAAAELLALPEPPTALVCGNDVLALGALSAARSAGVAVPGDLTVVGFDDIAMAGWPLASLTTVRCDLGALARVAVDLLLGQLHNGGGLGVPERRLCPELVLRSTHAPPR